MQKHHIAALALFGVAIAVAAFMFRYTPVYRTIMWDRWTDSACVVSIYKNDTSASANGYHTCGH